MGFRQINVSQPTVVTCVLNLSKQASSAADLKNQLVDMGKSSSDEIRVFAQEIFARVERITTWPNLYLQQEKEAAMLARKQKTCTLLEADDVDNNVGEGSSSMPSQTRKEDTRKKIFRRRVETHEDEVVRNVDGERHVRSKLFLI